MQVRHRDSTGYNIADDRSRRDSTRLQLLGLASTGQYIKSDDDSHFPIGVTQIGIGDNGFEGRIELGTHSGLARGILRL